MGFYSAVQKTATGGLRSKVPKTGFATVYTDWPGEFKERVFFFVRQH